MSTDFLVVLGHHLSPTEILALPATLSKEAALDLASATAALDVALLGDDQKFNEAYTWLPITARRMNPVEPERVWASGGAVSTHNPAGIWLNIGRRSCRLSLGLKWWWFHTYPGARVPVHDTCAAFARLLGSSRAIYLPDYYSFSVATNLVYEGGSIEDIEAWLLEHHGPPAPSIDAIYTEPWNGDGYFINRFADVAERSC